MLGVLAVLPDEREVAPAGSSHLGRCRFEVPGCPTMTRVAGVRPHATASQLRPRLIAPSLHEAPQTFLLLH
jgi:hypothetical protein